MSATSNIDLLALPALRDFPGTVSARLEALRERSCARPVPAGWEAEFEGLLASAVPMGEAVPTPAPVGEENPCARYSELRVPRAGGRVVAGRLIVPEGICRPSERVPLVLMFHDAGRPVRGWHHMTRFCALGYAVIALDGGRVAPDAVADALPGLAADALALARAGLSLPGVDPDRVCAWGEGLGGGLAVLVTAALGPRVARCAVCNPLPADRADVPAWLDAAVLARRVTSELLVGCGLRDELAPAEGQAALANAAAGPARLVFYPEHAHERINEFENEALRFLRLS
ncbi:MAG: acetylxylan esterase [Tractidigestivibacter sp.]|uniref:acetylxylan esterase n=1 Tax=Tractidigestivibacter sp. TaxID=2847320 RepID=UPI002A82D583|nr:acetylxylan esterase [Tractidigestivibacter sp.]MDY4534956.1 acetylxylan esterase [Tractidigestivibacter sp.]